MFGDLAVDVNHNSLSQNLQGSDGHAAMVLSL